MSETKSKSGVVREKKKNSHFSAAVLGKYPLSQHKLQYILDKHGDNVQFDPEHQIGQCIKKVDFTYWLNCKQTLQLFKEKQVVINELIFDRNSDVTDALVVFIS